jgi:hypothetical protein
VNHQLLDVVSPVRTINRIGAHYRRSVIHRFAWALAKTSHIDM